MSGVKQNILGTIEISLLLGKGAERFSYDTKNTYLSFIIPLLLLPLTLITVFYAHPNGQLADGATQILTAIYTLRVFVHLGLYLAFVYTMSKTLGKASEFKRFITANNWLTLPAAIAMTPLLALFINGSHSWQEVYPMMVVITLYSYVYSGFMIAKVLKIPYELAGFIAVAGMAIHQTSLTALKWAAIQTISMIS